jgi:integrase
LERAGLCDLHLHDLRRTLGSFQAAMGASLTIIGRSLGHRDQAATAIYSRINLDPVRASVDAAAAAIAAAGTVKRPGEAKSGKV